MRNCSVNTLFSCIVGRGNGFSALQWESCVRDKIFGVYDLVIAKANESSDHKVDLDGNAVESSRSRYKVNVHHSRDSAGKQWVTTQVLTLQGLCRVLRSFFGLILEHLDDQESSDSTGNKKEIQQKEEDSAEEEEDSESYETETESDDEEDEEGEAEQTEEGKHAESQHDQDPWLVAAWARILECGLQAASQEGGRDTVDLRNAGVELLVLCGQLSCKAGIQAAITPARVGTKMQVINGALREADGSNNPKDAAATGYHRSHSKMVNECRETLFLEAMKKMIDYMDYIEATEKAKEGNTAGMEATQSQVLQKFVTCLSSLYDCCKDEELSQNGDDEILKRYFEKKKSDSSHPHLECQFVQMLISVAKAASGGPRFLSQAQRSTIDLLRSMMKQGSSEAILQTVVISGPWLFW